MPDFQDIKSIHNFKSLIKYLRVHLGWNVDEENVEDLTFDYDADELGLDEKVAVKVREIKQIRPLVDNQPWGIFWIDFERKRLPVVAMRRILGALVRKKRGSRSSSQAVWDLHDLMFISATGEDEQRGINFAHFRETDDGLPQLRTFSWDASEKHFYYLQKINLEALRWVRPGTTVEQWREQWARAFTSAHGENIRTAKDLASEMAQLAAATRERVKEAFSYERGKGPLNRLYNSFKKILINDLSVDDFADMYAQTVAYGLFSAAVEHSGRFQRENVASLVPNTNPFLRDLLKECLKVSEDARYHIDLDELGVGELVEALQAANLESVLQDFGRQTREHKEDPVIHFYESFLKEYDAKKKVQRGVFYTPDPVVSFLVRSVDHLLRTEFDLPDGLADTRTMLWNGKHVPMVQILDPATGTGTFLKHVIDLIHESWQRNAIQARMSPKEMTKRWNDYVADHLLPRLFGFELMMAPYAVAHMKLGLALKETGYDFGSEERLRVYLTNALQPAHEIPRTDTPYLAEEAEEANDVKTSIPIMAVLGNPPYSGHSANTSKNADGTLNFIGTLLKDYYRVDGKLLGEKNPKWLQDDYVKFIRFGQWRINETGAGILAMITNHGFLDNPTFRGMRQQLMNSFSDIYVLDLHGNAKKKEHSPDGSKDENVFDIQQGVAISIFLKHTTQRGPARIRHANLWGLRENKYRHLLEEVVATTKWDELKPGTPFYFFTPENINLRDEYDTGWSIRQALPKNSVGVVTGQDEETIAFTQEEAESLARKHRLSSKFVSPILYRPFDKRFIVYHDSVVTRPRREVMPSMLSFKNIAILSARSNKSSEMDHFFISRFISETKCGESTTQSYLFPAYIYPVEFSRRLEGFDTSSVWRSGKDGRVPNLEKQFVREHEINLGLKFILDSTGDLVKTLGPEDIFYYIYAIFHSPTYRERYAEFLKIDFPRVPLTRNLDLFRALVAKGAELVALHQMESPALDKPITKFIGRGDDTVASGYPKYEKKTVSINDEQGFEGVPQAVWDFHIGGYQVCHKWLKDRRGRNLSADDKAHYAKIVVALKETIRLMQEIDEVIPGFPIE